METSDYLENLERSGSALLEYARSAGADAEVPSCPDWSVERLVTHQSNVHRWAAEIVGSSRAQPPSAEECDALFARPDDLNLFRWYELGLGRIIEVLEGAPPSLDCWTFLASVSPLAFWTRRQAHETSIHMADAALAAGGAPTFDPGFAEDGLDELLLGFYGASGTRMAGEPELTLSFHALDADRRWTIIRNQEGVVVTSTLDAGCLVSGSASDLYLFAWNRLGDTARLSVDGDSSTIALWRETFRI